MKVFSDFHFFLFHFFFFFFIPTTLTLRFASTTSSVTAFASSLCPLWVAPGCQRWGGALRRRRTARQPTLPSWVLCRLLA